MFPVRIMLMYWSAVARFRNNPEHTVDATMLAVFFATSDEMLPILLSSLTESSGISWKTIVLITLSKAALGILLGYLADLLFGRWFRAQKSIHSFCEREHCDCDEEEGSVFLAALRHTLKIAAMLIAVNFALNLLGCYVHDLRLQCLEFFKNFYQDGGKPFRPMTLDTEYVDLQ